MQVSWISLQAWALLIGRQTFKVEKILLTHIASLLDLTHIESILDNLMHFTTHISALIATMGDVNAAVERLLGGGLQVLKITFFPFIYFESNFQGQSLG